MIPHDFFSPQPSHISQLPFPLKLYFFRFTLHDWRKDDCVRILKNIRAVIPKAEEGGRLYIAQVLLDEDSDRFKYILSINMVNMTGSMERTEAEFAQILRRSGFGIANVHRNGGLVPLIEAIVAPWEPEL